MSGFVGATKSLVAIDLSHVSQNVVGTEGLWVLGFLTLRVRAIH
jgi:hypothetical protein